MIPLKQVPSGAFVAKTNSISLSAARLTNAESMVEVSDLKDVNLDLK